MSDVRQLTACSKRWAAERPRCVSLAVRQPDVPQRPQQPDPQERTTEAVLQAPFGIAALSQAASQALSNIQRAPRPNTVEVPSGQEEFQWLSLRRLATMEWLPPPQGAEPNIEPHSTTPCQHSGARQGDLTQGQSSGRVFPFATRDLPGRYDGVGVGRSIRTNLSKHWRRCECALPNNAKPVSTVFKIKTSVCLIYTVVCGCYRVG